MVHPNWKAYSEVWLHRMISYMQKDVVGIACFSPLQKLWSNKIECFDLYGKKQGRLRQVFFTFKVLRTLLYSSPEKQFVAFVKAKKPDVIFINFIGPALYLKKALDQIQLPVFIHVHGVDIFWEAKDEQSLIDIHNIGYKKNVLELIKNNYKIQFIANSLLSRKQLLDIDIPEKKIHLKYFGVPAYNDHKVFRKKIHILFLGRFVDFKGPDIVVRAFIEACDLGFDGVLTMAGEGPLKLTCQLLAKRSRYSERITFKPATSAEKAAELMQQADVFTMHNCRGVLSNMVEAFGVTIIEAMSYGVPVITGRCGGPEEIITDQYDGILVEPGDANAHAMAFIYLQNNTGRLRQLSNNGLKTVRTKFSLEQEKSNLLQILGKEQ